MSLSTLLDAGLLKELPPTQDEIDAAGVSDEDLALLLRWWAAPTGALLAAKDFNPDEPRDDHGQWSGSGSGEGAASSKLSRQQRDDVYRILQDAVGSGPYDGGCLIFAKALIRANGGGELGRIVSTANGGQTEHYGALINGKIQDFGGTFASPSKWIANFERREQTGRELSFAKGYDSKSEIPDEPSAEKEIAAVLAGSRKRDFNPDEPRDDAGRWTSGGGGDSASGGIGAGSDPHNDNQYLHSDGKYHVQGDVEAAVRLIGDGKDVVLEQPRELSTLLNRLAAIGKEASASGEKKVYDLCRVSVEGTNLFCAESAGIARVDMPQLSGAATPGSIADKLPHDSGGGVNATGLFVDRLQSEGHSVSSSSC